MKVIVPKTSGFCPGVIRAESGVLELHEKQGYVYTYGPLIHNQDYVSMLSEKKIKSVNPDELDELKENQTLVIRTHGIPKNEEELLSKNFFLKDLTCPIVKRVQKKVEHASQDGFFVLISGKKKHAEVLGLLSYATKSYVLETEEDVRIFFSEYEQIIPKHTKKIYFLSQTTYSRDFFQKISIQLESLKNYEVVVQDTICAVTENKEQESLELQKDVDFTVVIGDPKSSNSKKLYQVLHEANEQTIFIRNVNDLMHQEKIWEKKKQVLVVSSTSTPRFIEDQVVRFFEKC